MSSPADKVQQETVVAEATIDNMSESSAAQTIKMAIESRYRYIQNIKSTLKSSSPEIAFLKLFFYNRRANVPINRLGFVYNHINGTSEFDCSRPWDAKNLQEYLAKKYSISTEINDAKLKLSQDGMNKLLTVAIGMRGVKGNSIIDDLMDIYGTDSFAVLTSKSPLFKALINKYNEQQNGERFADGHITVHSPMAVSHLVNTGPKAALEKTLGHRYTVKDYTADDRKISYEIQSLKLDASFKISSFKYELVNNEVKQHPGFDIARIEFQGNLNDTQNAIKLVMLSILQLLTTDELKEGWQNYAYKYNLTCSSNDRKFVMMFIKEATKLGANVTLVGPATKFNTPEDNNGAINKLLTQAKAQHKKCLNNSAPPALSVFTIIINWLRKFINFISFGLLCKPVPKLDFIAAEMATTPVVKAARTTDANGITPTEATLTQDAPPAPEETVTTTEPATQLPAPATLVATPKPPAFAAAKSAAPLPPAPTATDDTAPEGLPAATSSSSATTEPAAAPKTLASAAEDYMGPTSASSTVTEPAIAPRGEDYLGLLRSDSPIGAAADPLEKDDMGLLIAPISASSRVRKAARAAPATLAPAAVAAIVLAPAALPARPAPTAAAAPPAVLLPLLLPQPPAALLPAPTPTPAAEPPPAAPPSDGVLTVQNDPAPPTPQGAHSWLINPFKRVKSWLAPNAVPAAIAPTTPQDHSSYDNCGYVSYLMDVEDPAVDNETTKPRAGWFNRFALFRGPAPSTPQTDAPAAASPRRLL